MSRDEAMDGLAARAFDELILEGRVSDATREAVRKLLELGGSGTNDK